MQGKIIKGIAGFYYVHAAGSGIYECKAKGVFRKEKRKPLVGDDVEIAVLDEAEKKGNIEKLLPRKNELIRPAVANIDMALVIFAAAEPEPNLNLLDRFLVFMRYQGVPATVCFNKMELVTQKRRGELARIYGQCGCPVLFISVKQRQGLEELKRALLGKTTAVAGPSGVGKSSLINFLQPQAQMETGEISRKIERGKQTTRHTQLVCVTEGTYIMDTPGFSSLYLPEMEKEELGKYYCEFASFEPFCRFQGCSHMSEPDCGVKQALEQERISSVRYENYRQLYTELKERRRYS